jgi:hypothetical protein
MSLHIRFPHSSPVAIAAAYILLPTAPADTTVNVVPHNDTSRVRLVQQKGLRDMTIGSLVFGLCLMLCKSPWPEIGLFIAVSGGALSMGVGVAMIFGYCKYTETHMEEMMQKQKGQLGKVLAMYGLDVDCADRVEEVVSGKREMIRFDTHRGTLRTMRAGEGYTVELDRGEKDVLRADLVRGTDIGGVWTEVAMALVDPVWAELIEMYR